MKKPPLALSQVHEIYLARAAETMYGMDLQLFAPFAMLPSIRRLRGLNIDGEDFTWPGNFSSRASTLTHIRMEYSGVSAESFDIFLQGIAALESFIYEHGGLTKSACEPVGIIHALAKHAAHSLETLDLGGQKLIHGWRWEGKHLGPILQRFARLTSLALEDTIFQIPSDPVKADATR